MSPRLLSLLSLVEAELAERTPVAGATRSADFRKGIARLTLADRAGGLVVQNFLLAGGQLCVRVKFLRGGGAEAGESAIYPTANGFDWAEAAARVAREWRVAVAGPRVEPAAEEGLDAALA